MLKLNNSLLMRGGSFVAGEWRGKCGRESLKVFNPFDTELIHEMEAVSVADVEETIIQAQAAFVEWSHRPSKERGMILKRWSELIVENWDDLARLLCYEQGKPYEQATHELMGCCGFLDWYAAEAERIYGFTVPSPDPNRRFFTLKHPIGVVAVITPWNFPAVLPIQKCVPALAAGCSVILKPAEQTPLTAVALTSLAETAGLTGGVFNLLLTSHPDSIGKVLTNHALVRKLTFTGSTEVGKKLMAAASTTVKKVCLELGGNCPALIFEDADLKLALEKSFWFKFYNAGQCCNSINRFLIHNALYEKFIEEFQQMMVSWLKMGSGLDPESNVGPLIDQQGFNKVSDLVADAIDQGATSHPLTGIAPPAPLCFVPTLLSGVDPSMKLYREEIFGPVVACYRFDSEEEGVAMANDTSYGLAAYIFTQNMPRIYRVMDQLEAGSIGINTCDVVCEKLPFGGFKESGLGRENGIVGSLDDFLEPKSVAWGLR